MNCECLNSVDSISHCIIGYSPLPSPSVITHTGRVMACNTLRCTSGRFLLHFMDFENKDRNTLLNGGIYL